MSAQAINLLLGVGRLYMKRYATGAGSSDSDGKFKLIGSIKKNAKFVYKPSYAEQRPSDTLNMIRRDKVEEHATLMAEIVDWRTDQLRYVLGVSTSMTTVSRTISIRLAQEILVPASTTTTKSLSRTAKSMTSVGFTSLDRQTDYVRGTDFTMLSTKKFRAISAAFKNGTRRAYYTKRFTNAQILNVGNQPVLQQFTAMFVHQQSNGKHIAITFPICTTNADLSAVFAEKEYTTLEMTFAALGDPNQPKGKQLFSIVREP